MMTKKEELLEKYDNNKLKLCGNDIEFICREVWARKNKKKILDFLLDSEDPGYQRIGKEIKKNGVSTFPYAFFKSYSGHNIECYFDKDQAMWYVIAQNGKRLYLKKEYKTKFRAQRYYKNLLAEQDILSPHCYCTESFFPESDSIIVDIGGAEGFFAVEHLDVAKHIYVFECNPSWIEAMNVSFKDYCDKVTIIPKYVSNRDDDEHISIDSFIKEHSLEEEKIFFKIDAEGSEPLIIAGGDKYFGSANNYKIALCTYHQAWHEEAFKRYFSDCIVEASSSYMLYYYDFMLKEPYLRKGLLRIETKN